MKIHTSEFKNAIKTFGRELDSKITYTIDGITTELGNEELNSVSPHYEGGILKSVMKQLDIDSNVEIPVGTELNYQFGVKTRSGKNLLIIPNGTYMSGANEITAVVKDGVITLSGTTASNRFISIPFDYTFEVGTYKLSKNNAVANGNIIVRLDNDVLSQSCSNVNAVKTQTFTESTTISYFAIRIASGTTLDNFVIKPQLEKGTEATSWEQGGAYDYVNYGNYIVKEVEKQEDTRSYKITCYDKMLYSMIDYENSNITYPITIRDYISAICTKLNLIFANSNSTFANYDKQIASELFLDSNGNSLGYTFRDVLDQLAEVTASTICINDNDELEIRYVSKNLFSSEIELGSIGNTNGNPTPETKSIRTKDFISVDVNTTYTITNDKNYHIYVYEYDEDKTFISYTGASTNLYLSPRTITTGATTRYIKIRTVAGLVENDLTSLWQLEKGNQATEYKPYGDIINEEFLKDINVNFGKKYGAVNTIVLSRAGGADSIYYPDPLPQNPIEIKITDNQIMNGNDRDTYMADIYNKLNGLEYYVNDFSSTGICYLELCDKYNVTIDNVTYTCIMFNNQINVTQGLEEIVYTDMPEEAETDYKKSDSTDRKINSAYIIANKVEAQLEEVTSRLNEATNTLDQVITTQDSTSRTIAILSTNIDADGNVNSVTTKEKRFTLNDNGLIITNSDTNYQSIQDETGTYYKDGNNIVGQYTKDGSKQKDLELFGIYSYGKNDINDNAMFVAQLYTDDNNEEAFGHFYNGGDL